MTIEVFVQGDPVAQGRPRFARRGNFVQVYDPKESKGWKKTIIEQVQDKGFKPFPRDIPLSLYLTFYLPRPKSCPKNRIYPVVKPDLDNLEKAVKDALKGLAWHDDSQVCLVLNRKAYSEGIPGVLITVKELKE